MNKNISFPDQLLFEQLGTEEENERKIRMKLKRILKAIQMYWPVRAKFQDGYFELQPSPPAVERKVPSKRPIAIVNKSV